MPRSAFVSVCLVPAAFVLTACGSAPSAPVTPSEYREPDFVRMPADFTYVKPGAVRTFEVTYAAHVTDVPAKTRKLRVWLPVPQDTPVQTISALAFQGGEPSVGFEKKFGNKVAYFEVADPPASVDFTMSFVCARAEQTTDFGALTQDGVESDSSAAALLVPDKSSPVDDDVRRLAAEITAGKATPLAKARAIYDHVVAKRSGKDDAIDDQARFVSLCRAAGVAAGLEVGLAVPRERDGQERWTVHRTWAFFRVPDRAWVPVDVSEAGKAPDRAGRFFGAQTNDRVTLSVGRDLVLEPTQIGAPLDLFVDPYAEADGKPVKTKMEWSYRDVP